MKRKSLVGISVSANDRKENRKNPPSQADLPTPVSRRNEPMRRADIIYGQHDSIKHPIKSLVINLTAVRDGG